MSFNIIAYAIDDPRYEPETLHEVRCTGCDRDVTSSSTLDGHFTWAGDLPPGPDPKTNSSIMGYTNTISTGEVEVARRRVVRQVEQWSKADTLALVVAYDTEAASRTWATIETEQQRDWILKRIEELRITVEQWKIERDAPGTKNENGPS
jgi:hypothetical protein